MSLVSQASMCTVTVVGKKEDVVWFALNQERPLTSLLGIWTIFNGDRGTKCQPLTGSHNVNGFPTTTPKCCCRANSFEGYAGDPYDERRARRVDARPLGRGEGIATPLADDGLIALARGKMKEDVAVT